MRTLLILATLAVAGCSTYEERLAGTCQRLGAQQGTPEYWQCVQFQHENDAQNRAMWSGVSAAGFGMMAQPQRQPWSATCTSVGNFTNCSGY